MFSHTLFTFLWIGVHSLFLSVAVVIAVIRFRQQAQGRWLMLAGAGFAAVTRLASYAILFIPALGGPFYSIFESGDRCLQLVASACETLFLTGVLLQALRGSSESARIVELEAIIRDRDH